MKLGLSTLLSPDYSPDDATQMASELNLDYVEIIFDVPHFPPNLDRKRLGDLREMVSSVELDVLVHGRFWDLNPISHYRSIRKLSLRQVEASIRASDILGSEILTVHPGRCYFRENRDLLEKARKRFKEFIGKVAELAGDRGISLAIETGAHHADLPKGLKEYRQVKPDRENLGITLDVGHVFISAWKKGEENPEESIIDWIERSGDDLLNVHLHDNRGWMDDHFPPGRGEIEFLPILTSLEGDYEGPVILELWGYSPPAKTAKEGTKYVREALEKIHK